MSVGALDEHMRDVPAEFRGRFREIVGLTDEFCDKHLNEEYKELTREMAVALCQENSPTSRGRPASWASGVVYSVGWVNFLTDPSIEPYMSAADIAEGFGVSESTMLSKSRIIRESLQLVKFDPEWCAESMLDENPLVWVKEIGGMLLDLRQAPREAQVRAHALGLIPYVYADRHADEGDEGKIIAHIGPNASDEPFIAKSAEHHDVDPRHHVLPLFDGLSEIPQPAPPKRKKRKGPPQIYVLRIELKGTKPPIWRRVAVPGDITLARLHDVIQTVMGWYDCHLHRFVTPDRVYYGSTDPEMGFDMDVQDECRYRLHDIVEEKGDRFDYEYDFGDSWQHRIEAQKIETPDPGVKYPVCLAGQRACPPEDCGGVWGYYSMLEAVKDPSHEMHEEYNGWLAADFDPEAFDRDGVNELLAGLRSGA